MEHSLEGNVRSVNELCRICTKTIYLSSKQKKDNVKVRKCENQAADIYYISGVDIFCGSEYCYSKYLCQKCFSKIRNTSKRKSIPVLEKARIDFLKKMYGVISI